MRLIEIMVFVENEVLMTQRLLLSKQLGYREDEGYKIAILKRSIGESENWAEKVRHEKATNRGNKTLLYLNGQTGTPMHI